MGLASSKPRRKQESEPAVEQAPKKRKLNAAVIFGAAFLVFAGSAYAFRGAGDEDAVAQAEQAAETVAAAQAPAGEKVAKASPKPAAKKPEKKEGVVAEVPLFGPQAMAVKPAEKPASKVSDAEAEKRAAAASVPDQSWDEPAQETRVEKSKPWGRGRLYLPTIHRIRLDGAGAAISGAVNQDGFTIVVPGRKAMESGKAIQKRDKRIMGVQTNNNARGATVKFEFRGPVPPYRVRLRQDFVEFLISAPEESVARL